MKMRRIYAGFSKLISYGNSEKFYFIHVNRFSIILKSKQKSFLNAAWLKLVGTKNLENTKKNSARLFFNLLQSSIHKIKSQAFEQCRRILNRQRSLTEEKPNKSRKEEIDIQATFFSQ